MSDGIGQTRRMERDGGMMGGKWGGEREVRVRRTNFVVRQTRPCNEDTSPSHQASLNSIPANLDPPIHLFRPLQRGARAKGEMRSRLSRRFDVGMVDDSCFARVHTLYKRKADKVLPQNVARTDGERPGGEIFWKDKILKAEREKLKDRKPGRFDKWLIPRFSDAPVGSRLTPERRAQIPISEELTDP